MSKQAPWLIPYPEAISCYYIDSPWIWLRDQLQISVYPSRFVDENEQFKEETLHFSRVHNYSQTVVSLMALQNVQVEETCFLFSTDL